MFSMIIHIIHTSYWQYCIYTIYCIARQTYNDKQKTPSWIGFNIRTRDSVEVTQSNIGYLPTINAPSTELTIDSITVWTDQEITEIERHCGGHGPSTVC